MLTLLTLRMLSLTTAPMPAPWVPIETAIDVLTLLIRRPELPTRALLTAPTVILRTALLKLPTDSYGKLECHSELLTDFVLMCDIALALHIFDADDCLRPGIPIVCDNAAPSGTLSTPGGMVNCQFGPGCRPPAD